MKMKKILAVLLGSATVLTLAACGDDVTPDVKPPIEDNGDGDTGGGGTTTPPATLKPVLEIEVTTMELLFGSALGDTFKNNIKNAKFDNGSDAKNDVVIEHSIQLLDGKINQSGTFTVKYSLTEGNQKVEKTLTVTVLAEDSIKLPGVEDLFFKPNGLSDNYLFDFDTDAKLLELQTLLGMTTAELQENFQYKYEIYNIENNEVIGEVYKTIGSWSVALPTPANFNSYINEYMTKNDIYELKFSGTCQIVKLSECELDVANGEKTNVKVLPEKPSLNETFITVTKLAPDADVVLPNMAITATNNLSTTWLLQFGWSTVVNQLMNDLSISADEVSTNFNIEITFVNDDTQEEMHKIVKTLLNNGNNNVRSSDVLNQLEAYMEASEITSANIVANVQIVKSENSTITQNIINSEVVKSNSFGHDLPEVIGSPFNYSYFWGDTNKSYAQLGNGDIGLFVNSSSDYFVGELDGDVLSVMGTQSESSTWWGLQLLGRLQVEQAGRYEAEYVFSNSTVSGWITVQGQHFYIEAGKDNYIKVKLDLAANATFKMEVAFGQNGIVGENSTIGNFEMDIQLKGLTKKESPIVRTKETKLTVTVGDDVKTALQENFVFAKYKDGTDAIEDLIVDVAEGLYDDSGIALAAGKYNVTYSLTEDGITSSVTVQVTVNEPTIE